MPPKFQTVFKQLPNRNDFLLYAKIKKGNETDKQNSYSIFTSNAAKVTPTQSVDARNKARR